MDLSVLPPEPPTPTRRNGLNMVFSFSYCSGEPEPGIVGGLIEPGIDEPEVPGIEVEVGEVVPGIDGEPVGETIPGMFGFAAPGMLGPELEV